MQYLKYAVIDHIVACAPSPTTSAQAQLTLALYAVGQRQCHAVENSSHGWHFQSPGGDSCSDQRQADSSDKMIVTWNAYVFTKKNITGFSQLC